MTEPLVTLSDVTEIELRIMKRMREFTIGEHSSLFHGSGFDLVGLRDWQAGDRLESIDWPQSTLTGFSPLVVRDFEQPSTSSVVILADASASTRCGIDGRPIAATVARAIATLGMSAVFFQDSVGLLMFDAGFKELRGLGPRIGKRQVIHCLDAYQFGEGLQELRPALSLSGTVAGFLRKVSMVPVVSDFLFDDADEVLAELARVGATHDVFVALVDAAFAFELPGVSAGWIQAHDVETGRSRLMSRRQLARMAERIRAWQDRIAAVARDVDLDVVRLAPNPEAFDLALAEFVAERRLRRK
ncbi:MAG TPA: DUF58 domain-containing protein [Vicinamibacterales bacterium]|jgi:uncharacterized protein (DUF58 family)|nr:DUF58 domain-containing protein [Vicinamibacterales bacterium]